MKIKRNFSQEHRNKLSNALKNRKLSDKHKKNISEARKRLKEEGIIDYIKQIEAMRKKNIGRKCKEETKNKIREKHLGKKLSRETILKISYSKKNTIPWNKGLNKENDERILRYSKKLNGKRLSKETINKIKETKNRLFKDGLIVSGMKGKHHLKETKERLRNINLGKKLSEITKNKIKESRKGIKPNIMNREKWIKRLSESHKKSTKLLWRNDEYKKNQLKRQREGMLIRPNKPENIIINFLKDKGYNFNYVGDGKFWIKGEDNSLFNPDLLDIKNKIIIEIFGDYWHNLENAKIRDKKRIEAYLKEGFKVLIIWEKEINNKEELLNKLNLLYN